jgi:fructokinase
VTQVSDELSTCLEAIKTLPRGRRLVAVAGPPGSGKSTLADALADQLTAQGRPAVVVPMDGFHLDNTILMDRGLFDRKGAPETFDVDGFVDLVIRLKQPSDLRIPQFDRQRDCVVPDAAVVTSSSEVIIVEGNYLLLDESNWRDLAAQWDLSIFINTPLPILRSRLVQRWLDIGLDEDAAIRRAEGNDLPNARRVLQNRLAADLVL